MNPDSEQTLNRFADGEMTRDEEIDFLAHCEIDPSRYRRALLTVVENRRIAMVLGAVGEDAGLVRPSSPGNGGRAVRGRDVRGGDGASLWMQLWTVAAVVAIVATCGYLVGRTRPLDTPTVHGIPARQVSPSPTTVSPDRPDSLHDFIVAKDSAVAEALNDLMGSVREQRAFPPQSRLRMQQHGWRVDEYPQIYLFRTEDGDQFAVPMHNADIRLVNDSPTSSPSRSN